MKVVIPILERRRWPLIQLGWFSGVWWLLTFHAAQSQMLSMKDLNLMADSAQAVGADMISPQLFQKGDQALQRAQTLGDDQKKAKIKQKHLAESKEAFTKAIQRSRSVATTFPELMAALHAASEARAAELSSPGFKRALTYFQPIGDNLEKANLLEARRLSEEARLLLDQAELEAIQAVILKPAREARDQALAGPAATLAPVSLATAQETYSQAQEQIANDRHNQTGDLAQRAAAQFRHAVFISQWIAKAQKDASQWETLFLQIDTYLGQLQATLDLPKKEVEQEWGKAFQDIESAIRKTQGHYRLVEDRLAERDQRIGRLEAELQKLKSQTKQVATELEHRKQEQDEQRQFQDRIERLRAIIRPDEGVVLTDNQQITVRLIGLQFNPKMVVLKEESYNLLNRLAQALKAFPQHSIEIQGHLDWQIDSTTTFHLSQQRADAVNQLLLKQKFISPEWIRSVGRGNSEPLSSEPTPTARALNRRIDIIIKL